MKTAQTLWTLAAAALACGTIMAGFYFNYREDLARLSAAREAGSIELAQADTGPETRDPVELETADTAPPTPPQIDAAALERGRAAFTARDWAACIAALEPTAKAGDTRFDVHYLLGLALRRAGRIEDSETALAAALAIAPDNTRALVNSARSLLELGRVAESEVRVRHALEIAPQDGDAWNVLGRVQLASQQIDAALEAFERAIEIDATNAYAHNNLGFAYIQAGKWHEAVVALEAAVACRADVAYFHNNLGVGYERLGRLDEAAHAYAEAVRLQPDHTRAQLSLARVTPLLPAAADSTQVAFDGQRAGAVAEAEPSAAPLHDVSSDAVLTPDTKPDGSGGSGSR
jgi:tetratricopeptide (TPR) repeat protein